MDKPDHVTLVAISEAVRESLEELGYKGWEANILLVHVADGKGEAIICGQTNPANLKAALEAKLAKGPDSGAVYLVEDDTNKSKH